jgi:peptide/nickel transport system permease protein
MPPMLRFILQRLFFSVFSFLIITAVLFGGVLLTPAKERAALYLPRALPQRMTEAQYQNLIRVAIEKHDLDAPYPVQYVTWLGNLVRGAWGYSPALREDVLETLLRRTPATLELTLYSLLLFMPFGVISGVLAARSAHRGTDVVLQLSAFVATALPPFIMALFLLSIFYAGLQWFPPERMSLSMSFVVGDEAFRQVTGLLTVDGLLNGRPDVTLDAFRHLVLPVLTLSLYHWATLQRVTRAALMDELGKDYLLAARARGIPPARVIWRHAVRNVVSPVLTSSLLSAASLLTGVFVVEIIFNFHGVSAVVTEGLRIAPDAAAALGFAVYSIVAVLGLMFALDVLQAVFDPRYREGMLAV